MLSLFAAVISNMLISLSIRLSEGKSTNRIGLLGCGYLTSLILSLSFQGGIHFLGEGSGFAVIIGTMAGILFFLTFLLLSRNIHRNGIILSSTFMELGVMIPTIMATLFFEEKVTLCQLTGILLSVFSIIFMSHSEQKNTDKALLILVLLLVVNGLSTSSIKVYEELGNSSHSDLFISTAFFSALCFAAIINIKKRNKISKYELLYGICLGVSDYFTTRFLLLALSSIPAVIAYPILSVSSILLFSLIGVFIFKEKLNKREIISIGIILVALILLNI